MIASHNTSYMSKMPAGLKFAALLIVSIVLYLINDYRIILLFLAVSVFLLISARVKFQQLRMPLLTLLIILGVVFISLGIQTTWNNALVSVLRLLAMCMFAYAVSLTTSFDAMLELFQKVASPLRFLGANPAQISLGLSLTIRFIPTLKRIYLEVREAQHARGLENNPLAVAVPLVIRSLRVAEETAEALEARGYDSAEQHK